MNILTVNLLFSTLVFGIATKLYLIPKLPDLEPSSIVLPILLPHALRHLGLMFFAPGAVFAGIPQQFTYPAALGDLLTAVLALSAIRANAEFWGRKRSGGGLSLRASDLYSVGELYTENDFRQL